MDDNERNANIQPNNNHVDAKLYKHDSAYERGDGGLGDASGVVDAFRVRCDVVYLCSEILYEVQNVWLVWMISPQMIWMIWLVD